MGIINISKVKNFTLVYLLIVTSGAHIFMQYPDKYLIFSFIVSVVAWFSWTDRRVNDLFVLYLISLLIFMLIILLYTDESLSLSSIIATAMKLVIPYLVIQIVNKEFLITYIKLMVFIASISLIGYAIDTLNIFNGAIQHLHYIEGVGYEGLFYVFGFEAHIDRNNSIFYEPGAYQIFINAALYILFFTNISLSSKQRNIYIALFIITLITTFSTTGFMIFGLMMAIVFAKSRKITIKTKSIMLLVLIFGSVGMAGTFQRVFIEKIDKYLAIQDITDTQDRRSFDMMVDLKIFERNIFGVGHRKYNEEFSSIGHVKVGSNSSNGLTYALAVYGLPFVLFYLGSYYVFFMRISKDNVIRITTFLILLIFLYSESYYLFSPILLSLIAAIFIIRGNESEVLHSSNI